MGNRKMSDCRKMPSESNCQLVMTGPEEELLNAAVDHAVKVHQHQDTPEFREEMKKSLEDAPEGM